MGGIVRSGTVSFATGEASQVITVSVVGDTAVEFNEEFTLNLSAPSAGTTLGTAIATRVIVNDDALLNICGPAIPVSEGNAGSTPFTFSLIGGLGDDRFLDAEGAQIYEGGAGLDRYTFLTGHGHDSIRDFAQGQDKTDFSGIAGVGFGNLQITYGGAGTPSDPAYVVVSANGGVDSISISLAAPTTLLSTDFIFA